MCPAGCHAGFKSSVATNSACGLVINAVEVRLECREQKCSVRPVGAMITGEGDGMSEAIDRPDPVFSVEDANRMLPLVRAIVSDLVKLSRDVADRRGSLEDLLSRRNADQAAGNVYQAELAEVERDVKSDSLRVREYLEELRQLGVESRGDDGEVDFPAMLDGRRVMLCWKLGESEVLHWHECGDGFGDRQLLAADSVSSGGDSVI